MIVHLGGGTKEDAERQLPEKEKDYPEPNMFGVTPAHGFFVRHVNFLEMNGIEISHYNDDARPAFVLEDVEGADFGRIKAGTMAGAPAFVLNNVKHFSVCRSQAGAGYGVGQRGEEGTLICSPGREVKIPTLAAKGAARMGHPPENYGD